MTTKEPPRITKAYYFETPPHMVIVFDQYGHQMPDYQGPYEEVHEKIRRDAPNVPLRWGEIIR